MVILTTYIVGEWGFNEFNGALIMWIFIVSNLIVQQWIIDEDIPRFYGEQHEDWLNHPTTSGHDKKWMATMIVVTLYMDG